MKQKYESVFGEKSREVKTWEVMEDGGLSGEPSPRFSGEMHGDIGEEGDS